MKEFTLNMEEIKTTALFVLAWVIGLAAGIIGGIWWFA